jgi:hypothetical protein
LALVPIALLEGVAAYRVQSSPPAWGRLEALGVQRKTIPCWESRRDGSRPRHQGEFLARGPAMKPAERDLDFDPPPHWRMDAATDEVRKASWARAPNSPWPGERRSVNGTAIGEERGERGVSVDHLRSSRPPE